MTTFETIKFRALKTSEHRRRNQFIVCIALAESALRRDSLDQFRRDNVNLRAVFNRRVLEIRIDGDTEVCGQRPRRRRPREKENFASGERGINQRGVGL